MIVPFPPGGPTDAIARVVADRMARALGKPIVIENVGGADGNIGIGRAARAAPDGYTINLGHRNQHVLNAAFYSLPYDVLRDFAPIAAVVRSASVVYARKAIPANDLKELIEWAKANPGKTSVAVYLVGIRLFFALFEKETGSQFTLIPYRGTAPAMQDLLAGQIDVVLDTPIQLPLVRAGSIKALAVGSEARPPSAPAVPTYGEMGLPPLFSSPGWFGLFAPKDTPSEIVGKLNAAAVASLADPAVRSHLADIGAEVFPPDQQNPRALGTLVEAEAKIWWPIIKEAGIRVD